MKLRHMFFIKKISLRPFNRIFLHFLKLIESTPRVVVAVFDLGDEERREEKYAEVLSGH